MLTLVLVPEQSVPINPGLQLHCPSMQMVPLTQLGVHTVSLTIFYAEKNNISNTVAMHDQVRMIPRH